MSQKVKPASYRPKAREKKVTHTLMYSAHGEVYSKQEIYGQTDLFNCLREMLRDGYKEFKISTHVNK